MYQPGSFVPPGVAASQLSASQQSGGPAIPGVVAAFNPGGYRWPAGPFGPEHPPVRSWDDIGGWLRGGNPDRPGPGDIPMPGGPAPRPPNWWEPPPITLPPLDPAAAAREQRQREARVRRFLTRLGKAFGTPAHLITGADINDPRVRRKRVLFTDPEFMDLLKTAFDKTEYNPDRQFQDGVMDCTIEPDVMVDLILALKRLLLTTRIERLEKESRRGMPEPLGGDARREAERELDDLEMLRLEMLLKIAEATRRARLGPRPAGK